MADKQKNTPDRARSEVGEGQNASLVVLSDERRERILKAVDELRALTDFLR